MLTKPGPTPKTHRTPSPPNSPSLYHACLSSHHGTNIRAQQPQSGPWGMANKCYWLCLSTLESPGQFVLTSTVIFFTACKRKEQEHGKDRGNTPKKPRLVFTDVQRRTLHAIFKENKRPSKELQITISQQLGLELSTVSNFFMNARRRSLDKWQDEGSSNSGNSSSSSSTCTKAWRNNHKLNLGGKALNKKNF